MMMPVLPKTDRISVKLSGRNYDAIISRGLIKTAGKILRSLLTGDPRLFVVTVPRVRRIWGKTLEVSLKTAKFSPQFVEMPDGESHKRLATVEVLAEKLTRSGADRNSVILALGGGVVGDVAGMLASLYMRGVNLIQIPTTLLAQVDASIGGKTGVNLRTGKNLLGTFHQPLGVLIDPLVLSTLPDREFRAGLYESLKCGVIGNAELFRRLENVSVKALREDSNALEWVITESVRLKAKVVSADEREAGLRRILNFGHTIGHALEAESAYKTFLHGEAVAWGMMAAASIASNIGTLSQSNADRIIRSITVLGNLPRVTAKTSKIIDLLQTDKKTSDGEIHFVLPTKIGRVEIVNRVPEAAIRKAVDGLRVGSNPSPQISSLGAIDLR